MRKSLMLAAVALIASGCYHVTVNTGRTPGPRQIEQLWAPSFVYGLVPPATVNAMEECGNAGVARVESQQSFLNGLVSVLTFGIFTPWTIQVQCGQGEQEDLPQVTDGKALEAALQSGEPFLIELK